MAVTRYTGGDADGDYGADGNWNNDSPANTGTHADGTADAVIAGNATVDITVDLIQSDIDHATIMIEPTVAGVAAGDPGVDVGTSGTSLQTTAGLVQHFGNGTLFYSSTDALTTTETDRMVIDSPNMAAAAKLSGADWTNARIEILRGHVTLQSSLSAMTSALLAIGHKTSPSSDAIVVAESGMATIPTVTMAGGRFTSSAVITTLYLDRGFMTQQGSALITTAIIGHGATMVWDTTGTGGTIHVFGVLDLLRTKLAKAITNVFVHPGGVMLYDPSLFTGTPILIGNGFAGQQSPFGSASSPGLS